ncbi:sensor histidine kinase [Allotamlana fucoidanivorans]|nr:ATP-binding protein [Tamlana fucoidanivorans]
MLSITFYNQFSNTIDDRILRQLNSIKTLKKVQIESLLQNEWDAFVSNHTSSDSLDSLNIHVPNEVIKSSGIYDFTNYHQDGNTSIVLVIKEGYEIKTKCINQDKITAILLERTGMGNSGESYLVGQDFKMRSPSRFLPKKTPSNIVVNTKGVIDAFSSKKESGKGVFKDYRGVEVYSAYGFINVSNLNLVILSEMDLSEATAPLQKLKIRLLGLIFIIMLVAIVLSLFLTKIITTPVINMQRSLKIMAAGDYNEINEFKKVSNEIREMFDALAQLKKSLQGAVNFSNEIGDMNLNAQYEPKSEHDLLGMSLIKMRDKLIEFRSNETKNSMETKRLLVDGLEKERQRLARELHDGIGPILTSLKFYIENKIESKTQRLEMKKIVDATISEIRLMSNALMPSNLDDFGVGAAMTNFVDNIKKYSDVDIVFEDLTKTEHSKITKNQAINIFRIGQELINNALKHANATHIRLSLSEFDHFISFFYFDDGKGFNIHEVKLGSGIINIKERVDICNGSVQINSKQGSTTFEIELPIDDE